MGLFKFLDNSKTNVTARKKKKKKSLSPMHSVHPASDGIHQDPAQFHSRAKVMERLGPVTPDDYMQINEWLDRPYSRRNVSDGDDGDGDGDGDGLADGDDDYNGSAEGESSKEDESTLQVSSPRPPFPLIHQVTRFANLTLKTNPNPNPNPNPAPVLHPIPKPNSRPSPLPNLQPRTSVENERSTKPSPSLPSHSMLQCNMDQRQLPYPYPEEIGKHETDTDGKKQFGGKAQQQQQQQQHSHHSSANNSNGDNDHQHLRREKNTVSFDVNMFPLPLPKYYLPAPKGDGNIAMSSDDSAIAQKTFELPRQGIALKDDMMMLSRSYLKRGIVSRDDARIARAHPLPQPPLVSSPGALHHHNIINNNSNGNINNNNDPVKAHNHEKNVSSPSQSAPITTNSRTVSAPSRLPRFNPSSSSSSSSLVSTSSPGRYPSSHMSSGPIFRVPDKWKEGKVLGYGSFGAVYEGLLDDGSFFAVKVSKDDYTSSEIQQELGVLSKLEHPNIVRYYGSSIKDGRLCIFLELVRMGSLDSNLKKYKRFEDKTIRRYTRQILLGLDYLHGKRTIHRDIKCSNILVDVNGQVKLSDFGIAKQIGDTLTSSVKGTPLYMAPEVITANRSAYSYPADIWSLGCTVFEMADGKPPWSNLEGYGFMFKVKGRELPPMPEHLSPEGKDFICRCFEWDPKDRPTAAELLQHPFVANACPEFSAGSEFVSPCADTSSPSHRFSENYSNSSPSCLSVYT